MRTELFNFYKKLAYEIDYLVHNIIRLELEQESIEIEWIEERIDHYHIELNKDEKTELINFCNQVFSNFKDAIDDRKRHKELLKTLSKVPKMEEASLYKNEYSDNDFINNIIKNGKKRF